MKLHILLCFLFSLLIYSADSLAQQYIISFKDKGQQFHPAHYYLSETSIRKKENKKIRLDESDLPVCNNYKEQVKSQKVNLLAESKWLNAILVNASQEQVEKLLQLHFIKEIKPVYPSKSFIAASNQKLPPQAASYWQSKMLQLDELHNNGYNGKGMVIAVFDNGFSNVDKNAAFQHLFLNQQIIAKRNFVRPNQSVFRTESDGEHGARVFSILAAVYPPQMIGTAYAANYILAATEDMRSEGILEEFNWLNAAEWADSIGVDIISSSLGYATGFTYGADYTYEELDGKTTIVAQAARMAARKGILVVNSAGNEGNSNWKHIISPADADSILAVGAVDVYEKYSSYSSQGPRIDGLIKPDISAIGTQCLTIMTDGSLKTGNGTSFACPMISGMSACIWQANQNASNMELISSIKKNASLAMFPNNYVGWGIPNAKKVLEEISGIQIQDLPQHQNRLSIIPNPVSEFLQLVYMNYFNQKTFHLEIYNIDGSFLNTLILEMNNGYNEFIFNSKSIGLKPGLYYLRLKEPRLGMLEEKKLLVIP
ncbi:MAG: S8 family serine peptidase [Bacteroidia bacterium]